MIKNSANEPRLTSCTMYISMTVLSHFFKYGCMFFMFLFNFVIMLCSFVTIMHFYYDVVCSFISLSILVVVHVPFCVFMYILFCVLSHCVALCIVCV
jgi:hypothetical protein